MPEKIIKKESKTDEKVSVNIRTFSLAKGVKENGPEVAAIREFIKSKGKDRSKIDPLLKSKKILAEDEKHNIIVDAGLAEYAKALAGQRAIVPVINYGLLGTGTPNVVPGATQLVSEQYRKLYSSHSNDGNIAYIDFFFAAGEFTGTATEFGNVIDGTASADTGTLHSYIATGGWAKTAPQSLFVSCEYHINNA